MNTLIAFIASRLVERSTWLGLITLLTAAGLAISPAHADTIATVAASVAGVILAVTRDHKPVIQAVEEAVDKVIVKPGETK